MAYQSEEEWAAENKPKVPKVSKPSASERTLESVARLAENSARTAKEISTTATQSAIATQQAAQSLLELVEKLSMRPTESGSNEPQPVRLIVNRKNKLIESIDVIPLVRKK